MRILTFNSGRAWYRGKTTSSGGGLIEKITKDVSVSTHQAPTFFEDEPFSVNENNSNRQRAYNQVSPQLPKIQKENSQTQSKE